MRIVALAALVTVVAGPVQAQVPSLAARIAAMPKSIARARGPELDLSIAGRVPQSPPAPPMAIKSAP